jgi:hypothetical protein
VDGTLPGPDTAGAAIRFTSIHGDDLRPHDFFSRFRPVVRSFGA